MISLLGVRIGGLTDVQTDTILEPSHMETRRHTINSDLKLKIRRWISPSYGDMHLGMTGIHNDSIGRIKCHFQTLLYLLEQAKEKNADNFSIV